MFGKRKPNGGKTPQREQQHTAEPRLAEEKASAKAAAPSRPSGEQAPRNAAPARPGAKPSPRPAPPIANPSVNNPIAGITAPSRGAHGNGHAGNGAAQHAAEGQESSSGTKDNKSGAETQRHGYERRELTPMTSGSGASEGKKLTVGRDIRLAGEITTCDTLVVEGQVECNLSDSKMLEIADSGVFKGKASVEVAEISGLFEGELTVTQQLHLRSGGRIKGKLRYREMEIERGGRISGDIAELEGAQAEAKAPAVESRPQPAEPAEQRVTPDSEAEAQSQGESRAAAGGGN